MNTFDCNEQKMSFLTLGSGDTVFVWAHGWGHSHQAMQPVAESLSHLGRHVLIDFPGFGASPLPASAWTIEDYARFSAAFIDSLGAHRVIWIGHSFGCRVGIKLASLFPDKVTQMVLVSAPGLPRQRPWHQSLYFWGRVRLFKLLKHFVRSEEGLNRLRARFGSADYNNAGPLRDIFMNSIRENAASDAGRIACPVLLVVGQKDADTPPDISERLKNLMKTAELRVLPDFDHYSILGAGRYQLAQLIKTFTTN